MRPNTVLPNAYVALRLSSENVVIVQVQPNTTLSLGKFGFVQANHIIGRPYHLTFEILDKASDGTSTKSNLRIVYAAELYANITEDEAVAPSGLDCGSSSLDQDGVEYEVVGQNGEVIMRTNRQIIDDPNSQIMTMEEIEAMKAQEIGSGKELIAKILESHSALDQKTAFALAKYTLRKTRKYLKRFTVLPLDVSTLARWIYTEKEPLKIMELREEMLALIGSWSNVHCTPRSLLPTSDEKSSRAEGGRWLVVDETAGLLVAYMAEKMGVLHPPRQENNSTKRPASSSPVDLPLDEDAKEASTTNDTNLLSQHQARLRKPSTQATTNTITHLHSNAQPNLSLLKYFHFDAFNPHPSHPLNHHLRTLSWLQLLAPEDDMGYTEPQQVSDEVLQTWKSGKRSHYHHKRRRWERIKFVVDETRLGGFDGLIVASVMNPITILRHTVPLLRGAAQIVVYSPTVESLVELADCYSTTRRTAFIKDPPDPGIMPTDDFPLDPTLLLAPTIQTARARSWQVLPGRTHPLMTGRGGSEGYIFTATRVLPAEGKVEARGKFKRRKVEGGTTTGSESRRETPVDGGNGMVEGVGV